MPYTFGHLLLGLQIFWQTHMKISGCGGMLATGSFCSAVTAPGALWAGSPYISTASFLLTPFCKRQCVPGVTDKQGWLSLCYHHWASWNWSQLHSLIFENLDFNLCFSCLCVKQRFSVYSRQRDCELAPWAIEFSTDNLRCFLGEIIAAVTAKTWKSFMQVDVFYYIA